MSRKRAAKQTQIQNTKSSELKAKSQAMKNSLESLTENLFGNIDVAQASKLATLMVNNRYELLFNNRTLLSELYIEHGIIQTLIDQPVDDAFRAGLDIVSQQLSEDDIQVLNQEMESAGYWASITQSLKWGRLFGGGGLVILTSQDPSEKFKINKVNEHSPLKFYAADLWELNLQWYTQNPTQDDLAGDTPYNFYGSPVHKSMVLKTKGKEAPSFMRPRMRGWGMTEVERLVRSFNQYLKNTNVIFELLDEAKIDVYKIEGFNASLMNAGGTAETETRIQMSNMLKNYLKAIVMDSQDDYEQKNMQFSGLGEMITQIRQGIASDVKMPITKLFGVSSAGFSSGEDDIENYNSMVESEVRSKSKPIVIQVLQIVSKKLFGFVPDDLEINWKPLRILGADQEQQIKDRQSEIISKFFSLGLLDVVDAKKSINQWNLLPIQINENDEIFDNPFMKSEINTTEVK